jgi:hypothetical protein
MLPSETVGKRIYEPGRDVVHLTTSLFARVSEAEAT